MSAPITIIVFGFPGVNTHLSDTGSGFTWCGLSYANNDAVQFEYEREAFGEGPHDCDTCKRQRDADSGLP